MIPIALAPEPPSFKSHVRKRGGVAIQRLLGKPVKAPGRKPKRTFAREADIPSDDFPAYWTETRKTDRKSTLDDLMDAYEQRCMYTAMWIPKATGNPTVDHFVPKSKNWRLVYEWSNYRLSAGCVNAKKGVQEVVDPFNVQPGWFELDLATFEVIRGASAPRAQHALIDTTLPLLNLPECRDQRQDCMEDYVKGPGAGGIDLPYLERRAPFIACELRRQGRLVRGDV